MQIMTALVASGRSARSETREGPPPPVPPPVVFATVTLTEALAVNPDVSVARAVIVCAPLATPAVGHEYDQLLDPVAAAYEPLSTRISTRATATLSAAGPSAPPP